MSIISANNGNLGHSSVLSGICHHSAELPTFSSKYQHSQPICRLFCYHLCWYLPETGLHLPENASICLLLYLPVSAREWRHLTGLIICAGISRKMDTYAGECWWLPERISLCDQTLVLGYYLSIYIRVIYMNYDLYFLPFEGGRGSVS